ncbi:hypothetical protein [Salinarimonas sp.]|uniref:hypothetical protein n=1 Tax=Salinarimonas sp. TaxID=2766526 RepID=UPI0032D95C48
MKNDRLSVFGVVPERQVAPAPSGERQAPARAARPTIAAGYARRAPATLALVDAAYRSGFPAQGDAVAVRAPNREIFARLLHVREVGAEDARNGAEARLALLRDAFDADRRFPSARPVLDAVEIEAWTWWHEVSTAPARVASRPRPQR